MGPGGRTRCPPHHTIWSQCPAPSGSSCEAWCGLLPGGRNGNDGRWLRTCGRRRSKQLVNTPRRHRSAHHLTVKGCCAVWQPIKDVLPFGRICRTVGGCRRKIRNSVQEEDPCRLPPIWLGWWLDGGIPRSVQLTERSMPHAADAQMSRYANRGRRERPAAVLPAGTGHGGWRYGPDPPRDDLPSRATWPSG